MSCITCKSERVANISSKPSDMNHVSLNTVEREKAGYVPCDMGIGGGDYIRFSWCLDCGQMQGKFPLPPTWAEIKAEEE